MEQPTVLKIKKIVNEAMGFKTFIFDFPLGAVPGQFIMSWLPRINEKPFSISLQNKKQFGITVMNVGDFTNKMFGLKVGDKIGIRGPYGKGFSLKKSKVVLIGGGCGIAPLSFLADELLAIGAKVTFIMGARNKDYLIFKEKSEKAGIETIIATDDGSIGTKGYNTTLLEDYLTNNKVDMVYSCGPEIMMKKVVDITNKFGTPCEVSLERYMKCGFGICGQCCLDDFGVTICKDGPVFQGSEVKKFNEFGVYTRDKFGKKRYF